MKGGVVLAPLLILLLFASSAAAVGGLTGGWEPIKDLKDPHVKEVAEFAVAQYNARSHAGLKLRSVVKGETQVVSGINYRLVLAVRPSGKYQAVVWEKAWLHYRNLTSFNPVST